MYGTITHRFDVKKKKMLFGEIGVGSVVIEEGDP